MGRGPFYDLTVPGAGCYFDAQGILHHNSGKDTVSAAAQLYVVYRLMLHPNPQAWLGLTAAAPNIDLVNVASDAKQAKTVFFEYVKAMLRLSPFFTTLLPLLHGFEQDRDVQTNIIRFPKGVWSHSLHSQARAAEGKNTLFAVMDEADAFRESSDEHAVENADEVHETLLSSAASRFPRQHLVLIISYPRHLGSFTIRRFKVGQQGAQGVFSDRGATWEIRPDRQRSDFLLDYEKNPEGARAKYECLPPATLDAFFKQPEKLATAFRGEPLVEWEPTTIEVGGQAYVAVNLLSIKAPPQDAAYWLHGDAGLSGDSYGLAAGRAQGRERIVDAVLEWRPRPGVPVFFPDVERVIFALRAAGWRILGVSFDRWNSAETIQRLGAAGLYAEALTFSNPEQLAMFEALKALIYTDAACLPARGPAVERLRHELDRLQLIRGSKVDHPPGESKDLADAVAAVCAKAYEQHAQPLAEKDPVALASPPEALAALGVGGFNESLLRPGW